MTAVTVKRSGPAVRAALAVAAAASTVLVHAWGQDLDARVVAAHRHTAAVLR